MGRALGQAAVPVTRPRLTPRETEVLLAIGREPTISYDAIAQRLVAPPTAGTVRNIVRAIADKIGHVPGDRLKNTGVLASVRDYAARTES